MGFLDHSTNNIIVDAVLTDAGRAALAQNDGSFQIFQFALGDDEVDYQVIEQYGRTVGKEKIEKNTPVLEALTAGSLGLKYKLVSVDNEFITHFPNMDVRVSANSVVASGATIPSFNRNATSGNNKTKAIDITVEPAAGTPNTDVQLIDSSFRIELNSLFFKIDGATPDIIFSDNIAVYELGARPGSGAITSETNFSLTVRSMTDTTFSIYSASGTSYIRSFVKVTGVNSGLTKTFELQIQ